MTKVYYWCKCKGLFLVRGKSGEGFTTQAFLLLINLVVFGWFWQVGEEFEEVKPKTKGWLGGLDVDEIISC